MTTIKLSISPNEAYSAGDIVDRSMTVGELRSLLEDFEDDDVIVTYDTSNGRGACWGYIVSRDWLEEVFDDDVE